MPDFYTRSRPRADLSGDIFTLEETINHIIHEWGTKYSYLTPKIVKEELRAKNKEYGFRKLTSAEKKKYVSQLSGGKKTKKARKSRKSRKSRKTRK